MLGRSELGWISVLAASICVSTNADAQTLTKGETIIPSNVTAGAAYGHAVAFNGQVAAMGSMYDGRVPLFFKSGDSFVAGPILHDPFGRVKGLGSALAMSGSTLVAGAPLMDPCGSTEGPMSSGVVQVYSVNAQRGASFVQELRHNDVDRLDAFGCSVAIDGDQIIAGAKYDITTGTSSGAAYVFRNIGGTWTQEAKLVGRDSRIGDLAGWSVDIAGPVAVVGAPFDSSGLLAAGSVQVFEKTSAGWIYAATLESPVPAKEAYFGIDVVTDGSRIVVGETGIGAAHVFSKRADGTWKFEATLARRGLTSQLGAKLAIDGQSILVGAPGIASVMRFEPAGATWKLVQTITTKTGPFGPSDQFGSAIAMNRGSAIIGARMGGLTGTAMHLKAERSTDTSAADMQVFVR